jgi:type I restriction enzyme S subunit
VTSVLGIELPTEWQSARLKDCTSFLNRGTAPDYADDGPVRAISQAANQSRGLDWSRTRFHAYSGDPAKLRGYLLEGDILVNSTGTGTLGRIGYFERSPDNLACMADGHITLARTRPDVLWPRFGYYWFASRPFQDLISAVLSIGATNQIELSRERFSEAPVPLPPIKEQRRIADFLDVETGRIDQLLALRSEQIDVLHERYLAALSEIVIPGLTHEGPRNKTLPWLPHGLELTRLGYFGRVRTGVTVDGSRIPTADFVEVPYLRVANVQGDHVDLSEVKLIALPSALAAKTRLQTGDVLMAEANGNPDNLGRGAVWEGSIEDMVHQNHVFAIQLVGYDPHYLVAILGSTHGRRYFRSVSNQVGIATINSSKVHAMPVPAIGLGEQRKRADEVAQLKMRLNDGDAALSKQSSLLSERRQALITAAVTGQIDVTATRGVGAS